MVASLFQVVIGFTGLIGFLLRFIGPLTIAPTITLVGVALFHLGAEHSGKSIEQFNYCLSHFILFSFQFNRFFFHFTGNHWGISMT